MKILIIGSGISGLTSAIKLKRENNDNDITIIEHLNKPFKKILATGNGKCNITNNNIDFSLYNDPIFAKQIMGENYYQKIINFLDSINIKTKNVKDLIYPITESSETIYQAFLEEIHNLKIKIHLNEDFLDYHLINNKIEVITSLNKYIVDRLIISSGGKSSPQLGTNGNVLNILKNHKYKIEPFKQGLCPIRIKENVKDLEGLRVKGNVNLYMDDNLIHNEDGEILFKKDGLSGIVIFNISSIIARNKNHKYKIVIDTLKDINKEELIKDKHNLQKNVFLNKYAHPLLKNYIIKNNISLIDGLTKLTFTYDESYDFINSQVSVGGLLKSNLNDDLSSKIEKNVSFTGEILNIDGPCGGYNLSFAICSGLII